MLRGRVSKVKANVGAVGHESHGCDSTDWRTPVPLPNLEHWKDRLDYRSYYAVLNMGHT